MERSSARYMVLHADLFVRSMDAALDFYCNKLGFTVVDDAVLHGPVIKSLSYGKYEKARLVLLRIAAVGAMIELQEFQSDSGARDDIPRGSSLISILVPNLEDHISSVRRKGLDPSSDVFTVTLPRQGTCHVVFYEDPDGNRLEFLQVRKKEAELVSPSA